MTEAGKLLLLLSFAVVMIIWHRMGKRGKPLTGVEVAEKLGLDFNADVTGSFEPKLGVINRLQYGNRYDARNIFSGLFKGHRVTAFDFRYHVTVVDAKNTTSIDPYCFFALYLPREFDEVTIYHEGLISKLKQFSGVDDIDFESHEFSRRFRVRSPNPRFAYDFCHARMIEYLLQHPDLNIEIDKDVLCLSYNHALRFEDVEMNLLHLVAIRELMPDYLFEQ